ncbi:MAG: NADH-quinone oxidoreductase subunit G [Thiotrichales bacterium]|nr:MAG: NADH-quinone oxidoreductase subunit G [Thiotrichales bacterium]
MVSEITVSVIIDGKKLEVPQGSMIIEAADDAGITIPRFCYHKKLPVAANCRMCLVELKDGRKPMPACATPITEGMEVFTKSPKAIASQKAVMEFLLINHPLDCPICDQGGECELQDVALGYGKDVSRFNDGKRVVKDKDIGPLIATDLTRCIHCTRCVRFGVEIAGMKELGMLGRGEHAHIATFVENSVDSEVSGNMIDLCPVGALTSKPYRFTARAWELKQTATISPHDCVGSNMYVHTRVGEVMRVVPKENEEINEIWLSDRDRYSYTGLYSENRCTAPMIKRSGEWEEVTWEDALNFVKDNLNGIKDKLGASKLGALASANSTVEELYLLQKLMRSMGSNNIDYRLRKTDFSSQDIENDVVGIDCTLQDIEDLDAIFIVGCDVRQSAPLLHLRMRKAYLQNDAKIMSINPSDFNYKCKMHVNQIVNIDDMLLTMLPVTKYVLEAKKDTLSATLSNWLTCELKDIKVDASASKIAKALLGANTKAIFLGQIAWQHSSYKDIYNCLQILKEVLGAKGGVISCRSNSTGAMLAGALPYADIKGNSNNAVGHNVKEMLTKMDAVDGYILLNVDPALDSIYAEDASRTLNDASCVVAITAFKSTHMLRYANVILPAATSFETNGSFINITGKLQSFIGVNSTISNVREAWKILRVLGNLLEIQGFDYSNVKEVLQDFDNMEIKKPAGVSWNLPTIPKPQTELQRIANIPTYAADPLVRNAAALQATQHAKDSKYVGISEELAKKIAVKDGDMLLIKQNSNSIYMPVKVHKDLAELNVLLPQGIEETVNLGIGSSAINIQKG